MLLRMAEKLKAHRTKVTAAEDRIRCVPASSSLRTNSICKDAEDIETKWKKQDLRLAKALKDYGFTEIYRSWPEMLVGFVDGEAHELPALVCFKGIDVGESYTIDDLISIIEGEIK